MRSNASRKFPVFSGVADKDGTICRRRVLGTTDVLQALPLTRLPARRSLDEQREYTALTVVRERRPTRRIARS